MQRRELIKGAALSGIAAGLLQPAVALSGVEAASALEELQKTLDDLEAELHTPAWNLQTPTDHAEAHRVLLHLMMHALQVWLEADPARPFFTSFIDRHKKMLGDNPDARYFTAVISDRHRYRIRGNLAGATYTSFTLELEAGTGNAGLGATLNDTEFEADANGDYEIALSPEKEPGNWMPLTKGAASITTRHYYERDLSINNDHLHHIPLTIENMDQVPPREPPSADSIAAGIRRVNRFIKGTMVPMNADATLPWVSRVPNQFNPIQVDDSNQGVTYAAKDNVYAMAPFLLKPDQALVIRGRFPTCRFSNVVLFNRFLQTLNYEERTISLNRTQAEQDERGNFEIVIAHRNPQRPNWLDTEGRPFGIVFWRFQLPEGAIQPLETEVISLDA